MEGEPERPPPMPQEQLAYCAAQAPKHQHFRNHSLLQARVLQAQESRQMDQLHLRYPHSRRAKHSLALRLLHQWELYQDCRQACCPPSCQSSQIHLPAEHRPLALGAQLLWADSGKDSLRWAELPLDAEPRQLAWARSKGPHQRVTLPLRPQTEKEPLLQQGAPHLRFEKGSGDRELRFHHQRDYQMDQAT